MTGLTGNGRACTTFHYQERKATMCGVAGFTGLGYLAVELRYDLVEALGVGIDKRGGHAAGAVVVPEDGQPRLMRKLGTWGLARGRFLRAAGSGHSVMMHSRYATTGSRDDVENAHPFAIKRKDDSGKDFTVLYGCHNGVLHGTWDSAKQAGRSYTVDSREFFELLADKAYNTIKALSGYGVVTFLRPEDRKVRVLRLSNNSDFHAVKVVGGGLVWASTKSILEEAMKYVGLQEECEVTVGKMGQVYVFSGDEAKETKVEDLVVMSAAHDRRTSGSYCGQGSQYWDGSEWVNSGGYNHNAPHSSWSSLHQPNRVYSWDDACWCCGEFKQHLSDCKYSYSVIEKETIKKNRREYQNSVEKAFREYMGAPDSSKPVVTPTGQVVENTGKVVSMSYVECTDGTYRRMGSDGRIIPHSMPIYVREKTAAGPATGDYRLCYSCYHGSTVAGQAISMYVEAKPYPGLGFKRLASSDVFPDPPSTKPSSAPKRLPMGPIEAPKGHNGHWMVPQGITPEEEREWLQAHGLHVEDIETLKKKTEEAELEAAAEELESQFAFQMLKGE